MILNNRENLSKLIFNDDVYVDTMNLEDVFIFTSTFARIYISYFLEIKILKKEKMFFLIEGEIVKPIFIQT